MLMAMALLLVAGCDAEVGDDGGFVASCPSTEADDVREAAFRWLFEHQGGGSDVACLGIAHGDVFGNRGAAPDGSFLDRFDDLDMALYPEGVCRYPEEAETSAYLQVDGQFAPLYQVGRVCVEGDTAVTTGSATIGLTMGSGYRLELRRQADGTWEVVRDEMTWIS